MSRFQRLRFYCLVQLRRSTVCKRYALVSSARRFSQGTRLEISPIGRHLAEPFLFVLPTRCGVRKRRTQRCERYSYRSLRAIELALSARREYLTKEGLVIYDGPDHYARLAATKHLRDFLSAGRPAPKHPEKQERRRITLQELEELLREDEAKKQALLTAPSDG